MTLISGIGPSSNQVAISYDNFISYYNSLNGKLCGTLSNLERKLLKFNQNVSSSCVVQLTQSDLYYQNCQCLRRVVFNKLNDYFAPSNFVSKNGKFDKSSWIPVFPSTRNMTALDYSKIASGTCPDVPYKLTAYFMYSNVGKSIGEPIYEIIGTYLKYFTLKP